jgi:indole-3-glycerol phosphate synthase
MIPNGLQKIAKSVEARMLIRQNAVPFKELQAKAKVARKPHDFAAAFDTDQTHIISEIKFTSPAVGELAVGSEKEAVRMAGKYMDAATTAISVLTEMDHFRGSYAYLSAVRRAYPQAILLMKDFVIDEYQILEARIHGADAILLIIALLGAKKTARLRAFAEQMDLGTLIEVHDEAELKAALTLTEAKQNSAKKCIIGVNNRDLKTLEISLETSAELAEFIPDQVVVISESGIRTRDDILTLEALGYRGFLIGGSLMQAEYPSLALKTLFGRTS